MIEPSPTVGHGRPTLVPDPAVNLAATEKGDRATANTAWRLRAGSDISRSADKKGFSDRWFDVVKGILKILAPRDSTRPGPRKMVEFEGCQNSHSEREIAALQRVVADMRLELLGLREREMRARYLAFHDDLTALPNRRFFRERLERTLADARERSPVLAVIYLDLDGFKAINDTYGHDTGDSLLNLVAARLTHALRAQDLVSRLGGDEYACLITGMSSRERLRQIAATLFERMCHPFTIGTLALTVRPSIGIALYPSDGTTANALLMAADSAMYQAKRSKSVCAFYERPLAVPPCDIAPIT